MSPQKRAELRDFIASCDLAAIGWLSDEGAPQSAVVAIAVTPELEIVFDTVDRSRKHHCLRARPQCSVMVWKGEKTVQYEGIAAETNLDQYKEAYFEKLPDGRDRLKWAGIAYFVIKPKWLRFSDFDAQPPLLEEFWF